MSQPYIPPQPVYRGPARSAHGPGYWLFVGWWLAPILWLGRVSLWVLFFPLGIWRSIAHSRAKSENRQRRGFH